MRPTKESLETSQLSFPTKDLIDILVFRPSRNFVGATCSTVQNLSPPWPPLQWNEVDPACFLRSSPARLVSLCRKSVDRRRLAPPIFCKISPVGSWRSYLPRSLASYRKLRNRFSPGKTRPGCYCRYILLWPRCSKMAAHCPGPPSSSRLGPTRTTETACMRCRPTRC